MDQTYFDAVDQMEKKGVDPEYIQGWASGYIQNPKREEQRVNDAYESGYTDGENRDTGNIGNWAKA